MNTKSYEWIEIYKELAPKLLPYKNNRADLIDIVKKIYEVTQIPLPTLDKDKNIIDIDPFTFYGLFNKQITDANRIKILTVIADIFDLKSSIPQSFEGIPVLNNRNATYYLFVDDRKDEDIDILWNLFSAALEYKDNAGTYRANIIEAFDKAINLPYIGNSKLTMGLFWIAPEVFLNLDSRSEWYIYESGKIDNFIVSSLPKVVSKIPANKYFEIVEKVGEFLTSGAINGISNFCDLSYDAYVTSQDANNRIKAQKLAQAKGALVNDKEYSTVRYWMYSPGEGAKYWDDFYSRGIMAIGWGEIGDLSQYETKEDIKKALQSKFDESKSYMNDAHATWQFVNEMKPGDIVFVKKGRDKIVGRGEVISEYYYDTSIPNNYCNARDMKWINVGEWTHPGNAVVKTLTDITSLSDYVDSLNLLFVDEEQDEIDEREIKRDDYSKKDFLENVFMSENDYDTLCQLLEHKNNIILQGAPGVGKTYAAKRLAYSIMGEINDSRVLMVQFHQSYSYEDFIEGFRPAEKGGFIKDRGIFYKFCKIAEKDDENRPYFVIIDEINRGNLSKIFGELFMLIENDKRGVELPLLYSREKFSIPKNIRIIGTMNTADRSLAMLDYALRRRFAFYDMKPAFKTDEFIAYMNELKNDDLNNLIECIVELNSKISEDSSLGEGFCIGHSYFCNLKADSIDKALLENIVNYEIVPLLKEYWFDEQDKVSIWTDRLKGVLSAGK